MSRRRDNPRIAEIRVLRGGLALDAFALLDLGGEAVLGGEDAAVIGYEPLIAGLAEFPGPGDAHVIAGVTEHGDDFAFSVECANGTSTNGTSPTGTGPNGTGASHA